MAASSRRQSDRIAELQETVAALKQALADRAGWKQAQQFWVKVCGEHVRIPLEHVIRFQAERDCVRTHLVVAGNLHQETLAFLERRLSSSDFMRIHRSIIVRRSAMIRIKPAPFAALAAVLADTSEVRVGRTYNAFVRASLKTQYFFIIEMPRSALVAFGNRSLRKSMSSVH